jgi:hypothetical protein
MNDLTDLARDFANSRPAIPERRISERRQYRTIWISDVHLGTRGCNAAMLIDFLDHVDSERMYLVGDIIDGWRLEKKLHWRPRTTMSSGGCSSVPSAGRK